MRRSALPGIAPAAGAPRRTAGDGPGAVQARARAAHLAPLRRGERRVPARVRALGAAVGVRGAAGATIRVASSFLPNDADPKSAIAWPNIQVCMQLFDRLVEAWPERTIVPVAGRAMGDRPRRPPLRLPPARGAPLVGRRAAHRPRRRVRHQAGARPGVPRLLGRDLLRAGERAGLLPRQQCRRGPNRRARAGRPHGRVPAGCAGPVLHERHEPPRRRSAASARDRARRSRVDEVRAPGGERSVPGRRAHGRAARARAKRRLRGVPSRERGAHRVRAHAGHGGPPAVRRRRPGHGGRPLHATARGPRAHRGPGRPVRPGRLVGLPRVRPPPPGDVQPRATTGAGARHRPRPARRGDAREHGGGHRRHRAALAPGPHARHRRALRSRTTRESTCGGRA